jgi:hypothetical protein
MDILCREAKPEYGYKKHRQLNSSFQERIDAARKEKENATLQSPTLLSTPTGIPGVCSL